MTTNVHYIAGYEVNTTFYKPTIQKTQKRTDPSEVETTVLVQTGSGNM